MATSTLQHHQPIQADDMPSPVLPSPPHGADHQPHDDYVASSLQDATPDEIPDTKSGVRVDPAAAMASARFRKGDVVQKPVLANGMRTKGVFTVYNRRISSAGYVEYQLKSVYNLQVESGWTREKELKPGS
ncbi:hypothetical protein ACJQWK_02691 [Exserohilum turcicum]|uniref:Uncharacterized protein n=1 Tax=Exserohilum turcicum (strain 28A) TaxID=671987 RepID=R0KKE1_EXST2|nr:uncharacterized protein SETTUDRAFT_37257 [Exserohilum turcica Et28A]EOA89589.1 hypothetical protein SETTUDRAFT_37257 [Exserohilum turcica Et28A]